MWSVLVNKLKQAWEWYGHADQAFSFYGFYTWLSGGGLMTLISWLNNVPWPLAFLFGLGVYGIGLGISNQRLWRKDYRSKEQSKPVKQEIKIAPQTEDEKIADFIQTIRNDIWIDRLFRDLIFGRPRTHPGIISVWRPCEDGEFYYIGKNKNPTEDEQNEMTALAWLVSKGLAKPEQDPITPEREHWYLMELRGIALRVKEKYESLYPHERRSFRG